MYEAGPKDGSGIVLRTQETLTALGATPRQRTARTLAVAVGLSILTGMAGGAEPTRSDGQALLQFGLFQKESEAWLSWSNVQRKAPEIASRLTPAVSPSDPARPFNGVVLRADAPKDTDLNALCRRLVGAGLGCLVVAAPAPAPPPPAQAAAGSPAAVAAAGKPIRSTVVPGLPAQAAPLTAAAMTPVPSPMTPLPAVSPHVAASASVSVPAPAPTATATVPAAGSRPAPLPTAPSSSAQPGAAARPQPYAQPVQPASAVAAAAVPRDQRSVASTLALVVPAAPLPIPALTGASVEAVLAKPAPAEVISYSEEDSRVMAEIDRRNRRQGRLGAVLPDRRLDVTPAVLAHPEMNYCALTFDDGPHRVATRQILDILNAEKVIATYFPVGKVAIRYGDLIRDFVASGHEIGNHSLTHSDLRTLKPEEQRFEISETNRILREFGANPILFRPPYGRYNASLITAIHAEGMEAVLWNVDTRDWKVRDPDKIVSHVRTAAGTGSVLLMHSTFTSTAAALPGVIKDLRAKHCRFVTLSQWITGFQQAAMVATPVTTAAIARP